MPGYPSGADALTPATSTLARPAAPIANVSALSSIALARILDQSIDCVKLIGLDGCIRYMNGNGLCAMEIDDFCAIDDRPWADLWPEEARGAIMAAYPVAAAGGTARFNAFCPTAQGSPRWWDVTVTAVEGDDGAHAGFLSVSRDITEQHLARDAMEIAAVEMKHRLKNTYTMIGSLLRQFASGDAGNEAFASDMADRLVALSTAQALFVSHDAPCEIARLIPALVAPFASAACTVTVDDLSAAFVDQGRADAIALVIGELSVNSSKHGALAHGGSIRVDSRLDGGRLTVVWHEHADRAVDNRTRDGGQGLQLMHRIMMARRGTMAVDWHDTGLVATLVVPVSG